MAKKLKICLAASGGGHTSQLLKISQSWNGHQTFCVTTTKVVSEQLRKFGNIYVVGESNRRHPIRVIKVMIRCFKIVLSEKPNVVISTGAAAGCIMCFLGRLFGAKIVWLDSITNINRISLSGKLVRHIADLFLVQWPHLTEKYNNVEYIGAVI
jgi:UDP-N-acetylglucosamine:LPS N-acetylglucosamine transferase